MGFSLLISGFVKSCKYVVNIVVKLIHGYICVVGLDCICLHLHPLFATSYKTLSR